jgi:hypothetical protein
MEGGSRAPAQPLWWYSVWSRWLWEPGVKMLVPPSGRKKILIFFQILRPFLAPFEIQEIEDSCMSGRNEVVLAATDAMFGWDS